MKGQRVWCSAGGEQYRLSLLLPPLHVAMTTVQNCSISFLSLSDVLMKLSSLLDLIKSHRITISLPSEFEHV